MLASITPIVLAAIGNHHELVAFLMSKYKIPKPSDEEIQSIVGSVEINDINCLVPFLLFVFCYRLKSIT